METTSNKGLLGVLLFSIGGTVLFFTLYIILKDTFDYTTLTPPTPTIIIIALSFLGFLALGAGLRFIINTRKPTSS